MKRTIALPGLASFLLTPEGQKTLKKFATNIERLPNIASTKGTTIALNIRVNDPLHSYLFAFQLASWMDEILGNNDFPGVWVTGPGEIKVGTSEKSRLYHQFKAHWAEPMVFVGVNAVMLGLFGAILNSDPVQVMAEASTVDPQFERNINVIGFMLFFFNIMALAGHVIALESTENRDTDAQLKPVGPLKSGVFLGSFIPSGQKDDNAPAHARYPFGAPKFKGPIISVHPTNDVLGDLGSLASSDTVPPRGIPPAPVLLIRREWSTESNKSFIEDSGRFLTVETYQDLIFKSDRFDPMKLFLNSLIPPSLNLRWSDDAVNRVLESNWAASRKVLTGIYLAISSASGEVSVDDVESAFAIFKSKRHAPGLATSGRLSKVIDDIVHIKIKPLPNYEIPLIEWVESIWTNSVNPGPDLDASTEFLKSVLKDVDTDQLSIGLIVGHGDELQILMDWVVASAKLQVYWEQLNEKLSDHDLISPMWVPPHVSILLYGGYSAGKSTVLTALDRYHRYHLGQLRQTRNVAPINLSVFRHSDDRVSVVTHPTTLLRMDPQSIPYIIKGAFSVMVFAYTLATIDRIAELNEDNSVLGLSILPITFCLLVAGLSVGGHWWRRNRQLNAGEDYRPVLIGTSAGTTKITSKTMRNVVQGGYQYSPNPQYSAVPSPSECIQGLEKTLILDEFGRLDGEAGTVSSGDIKNWLSVQTRNVGLAKERYRSLVLAATNGRMDSFSEVFTINQEFNELVSVANTDVMSVRAQLILVGIRVARDADKTPRIGDLKRLVDNVLTRSVEDPAQWNCQIRRDYLNEWASKLNETRPGFDGR